MTDGPGRWGLSSRFYLPNEDARVVCAALSLVHDQVRRPVFVGGSGMVLLEAASRLPGMERATYVDIAAFQVDYFWSFLRVLAKAESPQQLRLWFGQAVHPQLRTHYLHRGQDYTLGQVMTALIDLLGITFFFNPDSLERVKRAARMTDVVNGDIVPYLAQPGLGHDFVYLSNVPDYMPFEVQCDVLAACRKLQAPVYMLVTSACREQEALKRAWEFAGYRPHPDNAELNEMNRGLGSPSLDRVWNRPGSIWLLIPQ